MTLLERIFLVRPRIQYRWQHRRDNKIREEAIATIRRCLENADSKNLHNFRCIHNTSLYILLVDQDLVAFAQDLLFANSKRRRLFVARHLAVLLHEASQDLPSLIGGPYRTALRNITVPGELFGKLNLIAKELGHFKDSHQRHLKSIRNMVAAHRDKDTALQLATLDSLDPISVFRLAADFSSPLRDLVNFQIEITRHTGTVTVALRELTSRPGGT